VGKDVPDVDPARLPVDLRDQLKVIALDVEDREPGHRIGGRKSPSQIVKRGPVRSLRDPVPRIERPGKAWMGGRGFEQFLAAGDVQIGLALMRFAKCESVKAKVPLCRLVRT
jgi:hypothetical protein